MILDFVLGLFHVKRGKKMSLADIAFERKTVPQPWSVEEIGELVRLRQTEGLDWPEIARRLKRTEAGIKSKFKYVMYEQQRQRTVAQPFVREPVPADVISEQARRLAAAARDLTGSILGDPPRGFSALDQRLAKIS